MWRADLERVNGFDEAFEGVFGDSPEDLWDRFRAELTQEARQDLQSRAPARTYYVP